MHLSPTSKLGYLSFNLNVRGAFLLVNMVRRVPGPRRSQNRPMGAVPKISVNEVPTELTI